MTLVDPLFMACLLLGLLLVERTRERPIYQVALVLAALSFIGTLDREVMALVPLTFLMLWAVFTGRFRDLEATKQRLFELDAEIERGDYRA